MSIRIKHLELPRNLFRLVSKVIFRILLRNIGNSLRMSNIQQLKTKNKKIPNLTEETTFRTMFQIFRTIS